MTGTRQAGTEWVEIRLARPSDVRRLEIVGAGRTLLDYPRHLKVDSVDSRGAARTLFDDSVVDRYVESVAFHDQHPSIAIDSGAERHEHSADRANRTRRQLVVDSRIDDVGTAGETLIHAPRHRARPPDVRRRGTPGNYPLVRHPADTIAAASPTRFILTTVLAWDADRLLHGLHGLWIHRFSIRAIRRSPTPSTCSASRFSPHRSSGCSATPC